MLSELGTNWLSASSDSVREQYSERTASTWIQLHLSQRLADARTSCSLMMCSRQHSREVEVKLRPSLCQFQTNTMFSYIVWSTNCRTRQIIRCTNHG